MAERQGGHRKPKRTPMTSNFVTCPKCNTSEHTEEECPILNVPAQTPKLVAQIFRRSELNMEGIEGFMNPHYDHRAYAQDDHPLVVRERERERARLAEEERWRQERDRKKEEKRRKAEEKKLNSQRVGGNRETHPQQQKRQEPTATERPQVPERRAVPPSIQPPKMTLAGNEDRFYNDDGGKGSRLDQLIGNINEEHLQREGRGKESSWNTSGGKGDKGYTWADEEAWSRSRGIDPSRNKIPPLMESFVPSRTATGGYRDGVLSLKKMDNQIIEKAQHSTQTTKTAPKRRSQDEQPVSSIPPMAPTVPLTNRPFTGGARVVAQRRLSASSGDSEDRPRRIDFVQVNSPERSAVAEQPPAKNMQQLSNVPTSANVVTEDFVPTSTTGSSRNVAKEVRRDAQPQKVKKSATREKSSKRSDIAPSSLVMDPHHGSPAQKGDRTAGRAEPRQPTQATKPTKKVSAAVRAGREESRTKSNNDISQNPDNAGQRLTERDSAAVAQSRHLAGTTRGISSMVSNIQGEPSKLAKEAFSKEVPVKEKVTIDLTGASRMGMETPENTLSIADNTQEVSPRSKKALKEKGVMIALADMMERTLNDPVARKVSSSAAVVDNLQQSKVGRKYMKELEKFVGKSAARGKTGLSSRAQGNDFELEEGSMPKESRKHVSSTDKTKASTAEPKIVRALPEEPLIEEPDDEDPSLPRQSEPKTLHASHEKTAGGYLAIECAEKEERDNYNLAVSIQKQAQSLQSLCLEVANLGKILKTRGIDMGATDTVEELLVRISDIQQNFIVLSGNENIKAALQNLKPQGN